MQMPSFLTKLNNIRKDSFFFDMKFFMPKEEKTYHDHSQIGFFHGIFKKVDKSLGKLEKAIYTKAKDGILFGWLVKDIEENKELPDYLRTSFIYNLVKNVRLKHIILFMLVFFVAVDYALRDILKISILASTWDELLMLFSLFYIFIERVLNRGGKRANFTPMDLPILIFILIGICHVMLRSLDLAIAIEGFRAVFQQMIWFFIFTQLVRKKVETKNIVRMFAWLGLFLGLHAIYQYVAKVPMPGNWVDVGENVRIRAFSIIGSPNILGSIFVLIIPLSISAGITGKRTEEKLFYFTSAIAMIFGLLLTMSRGAWLAFAFAMVVYILLLMPKLVFSFMGLGGAFILFGGSLSNRLLYMLTPAYFIKSSKDGRLSRWTEGIRQWSKDKVFGLGLGRFGGAVATNNNLAPFYLDNYYLKTLTEMGLYGLVTMILLFLTLIYYSLKIIHHQKNLKDRIMCSGILAGIIGVLAHNGVENIFEVPAMVAYFWIFAAMMMAYRPLNSFNEK